MLIPVLSMVLWFGSVVTEREEYCTHSAQFGTHYLASRLQLLLQTSPQFGLGIHAALRGISCSPVKRETITTELDHDMEDNVHVYCILSSSSSSSSYQPLSHHCRMKASACFFQYFLSLVCSVQAGVPQYLSIWSRHLLYGLP